MTTSTSISFNLLDSRIQKWIWQQGWSGLKDIQENSIPYVLRKDCDIIISATTAGGKTRGSIFANNHITFREAQFRLFCSLYKSIESAHK